MIFAPVFGQVGVDLARDMIGEKPLHFGTESSDGGIPALKCRLHGLQTIPPFGIVARRRFNDALDLLLGYALLAKPSRKAESQFVTLPALPVRGNRV